MVMFFSVKIERGIVCRKEYHVLEGSQFGETSMWGLSQKGTGYPRFVTKQMRNMCFLKPWGWNGFPMVSRFADQLRDCCCFSQENTMGWIEVQLRDEAPGNPGKLRTSRCALLRGLESGPWSLLDKRCDAVRLSILIMIDEWNFNRVARSHQKKRVPLESYL